jgi:hypothetical protein
MDILIYILIFLTLLNLIVLIYLGAYMVRWIGFLTDVLTNLMPDNSTENVAQELPLPNFDLGQKTWDQKYEEELDFIQQQIKKEKGLSGLMDIQ